MGRNTYTHARLEAVCKSLIEGNTVRCACHLAGITEQALNQWIKLSESGDARYAHVASLVAEVIAQAESAALSAVLAGVPQWQSRAWWLERRFSDWRITNVPAPTSEEANAEELKAKYKAALDALEGDDHAKDTSGNESEVYTPKDGG
jgi:adenylate kinase family enzyme